MSHIEDNDCLLKIREIYSSLKPAEKKVAHYILENPADVVHFSITEFAFSCKASETTIFRLCNKLGYRGYQELKINLARIIIEPAGNIFEGIKQDDDTYIVMQKVMNSSIYSLKKTINENDAGSMDQAVAMTLKAKNLMFFGMGGSSVVALDAYHQFLRIGSHCKYESDPYLQAIHASMAEKDDVIFAFSASGSNKDLIESAQIGKSHGAKIISITSNDKSPLQTVSDVVLLSYGKESMLMSEAMNSRITSLILIDCLFVNVALQRFDVTLENIDKIRSGIALKRC